MSDGQLDERDGSGSPIVAWLREHYQGVTILVTAVFMLWVRTRSYGNFVQDGEVFFSGNDAYYHLREVSYTVANWPRTMPYDPWTYYPHGTSVDQFGTLYDQVVATAALVVGLGSPSEGTIALTLLLAPAVIGAVTVVPVYFAGKRVGGTYGGIFAAIVLALLPGAILSRSVAGASDHHAAEVLAQMTAVLAIMVALGVAQQEKPVYELVLDRDVEALRRPIGWAALAGVAMGLYVWTWPPAVFLVGIVGAFVAIKMAADYYHGTTPEPTAFVGVVAMTVTGVLSLLPLSTLGFTPTSWSLLQPLTAFGVAGGAVFLAWLARQWDDRDLDRALYPVSIAGIALVGTVLVSQLLPSLWGTLANNFQRIIGFSAGAGTRTIREAQPFLSQTGQGITAWDVIMTEYGLVFFTALLALGYMLARPLFTSHDRGDHATLLGGLAVVAVVYRFDVGGLLLDYLPVSMEAVVLEMVIVASVIVVAMVRGDHDAEELFVAVWALFMIAAAFTQVRFNYYLALSVAVLNAYGMKQFLLGIDVIDVDGSFVKEIEPYQMMAAMLAVIVILPVLITPITYAQPAGPQQQGQATSNAIDTAKGAQPGGIQNWQGTLEWIGNSTPAEGTYGGADNRMDPYGTYDETDDYTYPRGSYGVMSWWDYGHWLTVESERIPNANPFQQGATHAANYLLSPNESHANDVLARGAEENEETRYVVIDGQMADPYGKFSAPTVFYDDADVSYEGDFVSPVHYAETGNGQLQPMYRLNKQRYYESTMIRLYRFNGSRTTPAPVVVNWEETQAPNGETIRVADDSEIEGAQQLYSNTPGIYQFRSVQQARQTMEQNGDDTYSIGGLLDWPREPVDAVENHRLVHASESTRQNAKSNVKVFERVSGATVTGDGAQPNATVTASVQMQMESRNANFTYTQQTTADENGEFEFTIPYSTTGYDEWGTEEGYTDVNVRATESLRISSNTSVVNGTEIWADTAQTEVPEANVVGEDDSGIDVTLERTKIDEFDTDESGNESESPGNESGTPGNETEAPGNETDLPDNETELPGNETGAPGNDSGPAGNDSALRDPPSTASDVVASGAAGEPSRAAALDQPVTDGGAASPSMEGAGLAGGAQSGSPDGTSGSAPVPQWVFVLAVAGVMLLEVRDERGR